MMTSYNIYDGFLMNDTETNKRKDFIQRECTILTLVYDIDQRK